MPREARDCRKREVRARTENVERLSRRHLTLLHVDYPEGVERPRTRGDCADVPRPCPFVSCSQHLYLDAVGGSVKFNFPDLEPDELAPDASCALDVAEAGGATLERAGELMNVTRERVRQIENIALTNLKAKAPRKALSALSEFAEHASDVESPWDEHRSDSGGSGGAVDEEASDGFHGGAINRAADVDPDALFCDRVDRAYELALTRREKGWERPALLPVPEPPPLTEEQEERIAAALETEIDGWAPPPEDEIAPPAPTSDVRVRAPETETTTREGPIMKPKLQPIPPKAADVLRFLNDWFKANTGDFEYVSAAGSYGMKPDSFRVYLSKLRRAGYLTGNGEELRLADGIEPPPAPAAEDGEDAAPAPARNVKPAARRERAEKPARAKSNGTCDPTSSKHTDAHALAVALRARRARLAGEIAAIDTLLEAYAS